MAGIEDYIEVFRGERVNLNPFKKRSSSMMNEQGKKLVGKFITDKADEAAHYTRGKFPAVIKSAKLPKETFIKAMETFDDKVFKNPSYPKDSRFFYGLIDEADKGKLKIDILKTLGVNIKNLTPLAMKGLNIISSLPVATATMLLQSTPANADEANMKLEDFARLRENLDMGSMDKSIETEPKDL